jgi:hypothetical protein
MPAPMNIAQAADTVDLSVQKMWLKSSDPEPMYKKYFNYRKTEDLYDKDSSITGLSIADFNPENGVIVADVPVQGFKKTYTQTQVDIMTSYTQLMWRFGIKKRDLQNIVDELRNAVARLKEQLCAERLDNMASTSYTHTGPNGNTTITITGGDGLAALTSSHTREDGGTNMNNGVFDGTTYNLPFDYAGLKAAYRTASLMVDGRGNPRVANLDTLVCKLGSAVHLKAMEVLGAIKAGKIPESFDNDGSGVRPFTILALEWLQNGSQWYMFDSSRALTDKEGFQFVESLPTTAPQMNVVFKTNEIQYKVDAIFDLGHNDVARCWVGSLGTSQVLP